MGTYAIGRPESTEYAEYYGRYVQGVVDADIVDVLEGQPAELRALLEGMSDEQALFRYAPGKWSIKQTVGHLSDCERVFAYRALRFARGDATPLASFDENAWVANAHLDERSLAMLLDEFESVRHATTYLFGNLDDDELMRSGTASQNQVTVRALAYIIAGHTRHHIAILKERYLA